MTGVRYCIALNKFLCLHLKCVEHLFARKLTPLPAYCRTITTRRRWDHVLTWRTGDRLNVKTRLLTSIGIPFIKIRRPHDHIIMDGNPYTWKARLCIEMQPCVVLLCISVVVVVLCIHDCSSHRLCCYPPLPQPQPRANGARRGNTYNIEQVGLSACLISRTLRFCTS